MILDRLLTLGALLLAQACAAPALAPAPQPSSKADTSDPDALRVALCQIEVRPDLELGLAAVDRALEQASAQGAALAVFPEACLLGWVNPEAHTAAAPIPGATTARLGALAERHGLMVAIGLAERDGDALHNSAVLIDSDGTLLLRHRKVNVLSELMDPPYTPGDGRPAVVDTRLGRIALLICADTFEAPIVEAVGEQHPQLVLVPYGWAAPAGDWPEHGESLHGWIAHTARAVDAPVVGVDSTGEISHGPWAGLALGGQSFVCDRTGTPLAQLADRRTEVRVVEIVLPQRSAAIEASNGAARGED